MEANLKKQVIADLKKQILNAQGYKAINLTEQVSERLPLFADAFPDRHFPIAGLHEFITHEPEESAASIGFINALLTQLNDSPKPFVWISSHRNVFPPALKRFGLQPEQVIFIDLHRPKEILWVLEEALKCENLGAVVAELPELSFSESRRLQLVIEKSKVSGFILRNAPRYINNTTCVARWQIKPLPSILPEGMPGIGQPSWHVRLIKIKNATPASFKVCWNGETFEHLTPALSNPDTILTLKTG